MKRTTLIAAVFAALIVASGFAVAAPGNAPVDVDTGAASPDDHADTTPQDASDHDDNRENGAAADENANDRSGQGPAVDLPAQVPDHVSAIHDKISSFLGGDLEGTLGDAISEVTPDDGDEQTESDTADDQPASNDSVEQTESSDSNETEA